MLMRGAMKLCLVVTALTTVAGMSAPAMATETDSFNISVSGTDGVFSDPNSDGGGIYFAGATQFYDNTHNVMYNVFSDDFGDQAVIRGTDNYYVEGQAYADNYLKALEPPADNSADKYSVAREIAALNAYGLSNLGNAKLDEYVQLAIWKVEGSISLSSLSGATLAGVDALVVSRNTAFWDSYWGELAAMGWRYGELVSPDAGCRVKTLTFNSGCQLQGQMYLYGQNGLPPNLIPEPGSLGLFGMGLLGFGMLWLRRKSAGADLNGMG
jgi:hypothetical protein